MSGQITLESLGISQNEVVERVVQKIADNLLHAYAVDDEGDEVVAGPTKFMAALQARVIERMDCAIEEIAAKNVLPNVASYVEGLVLEQTNKWGERVGKPVTFIEYLVQRAETYLTEPVNYEGKTKEETGGYSWSKAQTRITWLVNKHLQYSIETAMKQALSTANSAIVKGLEETVKIKLAEVASKLKVKVE
jgi:hypothetical protein